MTSFEVVSMGRVGVDLCPLQTGTRLPDVETFGRFLGGSAANVAVAAARYGRRVALVTRTGADPFGEYVHRALRDFGVDDRWVLPVAGLPTPVTFCEVLPPDTFPSYSYGCPRAPDLEIRPEELDLPAIRTAGVFWFTGTGLCELPSRDAHFAALGARGRAPNTVFDLDYRPGFWPSRDDARAAYESALRYATVAVGNLDECATAVGEREPHAAAAALLARGVRLAVVRGPSGVLARTADEVVEVPPVPIEVRNRLGAGDAFGGALCHGLLAGWPLDRTIRFGNAAGALVASRLGGSAAMPTGAEVDKLLTEPPDLLAEPRHPVG
ncbi:5-dehydro-2-deoxygluconokinase [Plantactinospora sp. B6F1]|uniref:5-dehydro-2-deoxygluconokinase n=1 Tax=Plantactinospora sp. B6F1 TaxID=3158971 RepID=UPI0032D93903